MFAHARPESALRLTLRLHELPDIVTLSYPEPARIAYRTKWLPSCIGGVIRQTGVTESYIVGNLGAARWSLKRVTIVDATKQQGRSRFVMGITA